MSLPGCSYFRSRPVRSVRDSPADRASSLPVRSLACSSKSATVDTHSSACGWASKRRLSPSRFFQKTIQLRGRSSRSSLPTGASNNSRSCARSSPASPASKVRVSLKLFAWTRSDLGLEPRRHLLFPIQIRHAPRISQCSRQKKHCLQANSGLFIKILFEKYLSAFDVDYLATIVRIWLACSSLASAETESARAAVSRFFCRRQSAPACFACNKVGDAPGAFVLPRSPSLSRRANAHGFCQVIDVEGGEGVSQTES